MADVLTRYGPAVPGVAGSTLITAGLANTYTVLRHLHVVNTSAAACWYTAAINGVLAANALYWQLVLQPGDFLDWTGNIPLIGNATTPDTLQHLAQTATSLTVVVGTVVGP